MNMGLEVNTSFWNDYTPTSSITPTVRRLCENIEVQKNPHHHQQQQKRRIHISEKLLKSFRITLFPRPF